MSKVSKQVQQCLDVKDHLINSIDVHGPATAKLLAQRTPDHTEAERLKLIASVRADINQHADLLLAREHDYTAELADDPLYQDARDKALANAMKIEHNIAVFIENNGGKIALRTYGMHGTTPRTAGEVVVHLGNCISLLNRYPKTFHDPLTEAEVPTTLFATQLQNVLAPLRAALSDLKRDTEENRQALLARDTALISWNDIYQSNASILEGLYRRAGLKSLAAAVRPTKRRARGEVGAQDLPPIPATTEAASATPSDNDSADAEA